MRILCGLDTEYGLLIEGRGADTQIEDSQALVRAYPGECFVGWDYRYESPRSDLRGFKLSNLTADPIDAKYDQGKSYASPHEVRSDRILANGARLYNDHGHPEYATPECLSIHELARHDSAGALTVLQAARAYEAESGHSVTIYKNNTDFQGASWGTHENYLVPRKVGFEALYAALLPLMIVRPILVGAGKVGSEAGEKCHYQISQRADFFVEPANAETLYRRPIFNTRDEPHADPRDWIRLHVICGDSNMIPNCTARKAGLMKLGIELALVESAPSWQIQHPVSVAQAISKDESYEFRVPLLGSSWTTASEIFESYFAAAEATLDLDDDLQWTIETSRELLNALDSDWNTFRRSVDWAAKRHMLEALMAEEGLDWRDPTLRAYDLEYHNADPAHSLYGALLAMAEVEPSDLSEGHLKVQEGTRALARAAAVTKFRDQMVTGCWRTLTLRTSQGEVEVELPPDLDYPQNLEDTENVESFIQVIRSIQ